MKGIVNAFLNRRIKEPSVNAENPSYYSPGDVVEIVDILNGDEYNGNKVWYQLDDGSYVWSGGIYGNKDIIFDSIKDDASSEKTAISLINELKIKEKLKGSGEGISVLIADSGIELTHPALTHAVSKNNSKSFIKDENNLTDLDGHGTQLTGLIASKLSSHNTTVQGVAVNSLIYNYRIVNNDSITDNGAFSDLIKNLKQNQTALNQIDIINLSFDFNKILKKSLNELTEILVQKGIIVVVAGGDNYSTTNFIDINNVISIGVFDNTQQINLSKIPYNYFFINNKIITTDIKKSYKKVKGDSIYTALTTGIIANYLSTVQIKKANRLKQVILFLDSISYDFNQNENNNYLKLYKGKKS